MFFQRRAFHFTSLYQETNIKVLNNNMTNSTVMQIVLSAENINSV